MEKSKIQIEDKHSLAIITAELYLNSVRELLKRRLEKKDD